MSIKRVEYHAGAASDVRSAVTWYQERSPKAALDFIQELQKATETISDAPDRWPIAKNKARRFQLWRFPFTIIYSEQESMIMIWAVAHGNRRPEYWAQRF